MATKGSQKFKQIKHSKTNIQPLTYRDQENNKRAYSIGKDFICRENTENLISLKTTQKLVSNKITELQRLNFQLKDRENVFNRKYKIIKDKKKFVKEKIIETDEEIFNLSKSLEDRYEDFLFTSRAIQDDDVVAIISKLNTLRQGLETKASQLLLKENQSREREKRLDEMLNYLDKRSLNEFNEMTEIIKLNFNQEVENKQRSYELENLPPLVLENSTKLSPKLIGDSFSYDSNNIDDPIKLRLNSKKRIVKLIPNKSFHNIQTKNKTTNVYLKPPRLAKPLNLSFSQKKNLISNNSSFNKSDNDIKSFIVTSPCKKPDTSLRNKKVLNFKF